MKEYYAIKEIKKNTFERKTKEVDITVNLFDDGKRVVVSGIGDNKHHLVEDTIILLKKILGGHENL